ncbi:MAG TPA: 16S rRNA (guanine(527)-N(7))-methyltransferase RsmG [Stellaceae bacterium]|nr:16S rRNA (guanine(527)-N(7))-methyltransferase RsmG [Stellaceae bacterium]
MIPCPPNIAATLNVSRETMARLEAYVELLARWNHRINLVSAASLGEVWRRHILDSAQLHGHIPGDASSLVDLGSGAGLPGLVLAILGVRDVHLIESDRRKSEFLREVARITGTAVTIHPARIEAVDLFAADVVTARALAPLDKLLSWATRFTGPETIGLFLKGRELADELTSAGDQWIMRTQVLGSLSDPQGHILRVEGLQHAPCRNDSGFPES